MKFHSDEPRVYDLAERMIRCHGFGAIDQVLHLIDEATEAEDDHTLERWDAVYGLLNWWERGRPSRTMH